MNSFIEFDFFLDGSYRFPVHAFLESERKAVQHKLMFLKCAHPDCSSDFDYGQGRLFRFQQTSAQLKQPSHWHAMKHYWLCSRCCDGFLIEYQKGVGVLLMERLEKLAGAQPCYYVLQAEAAPKQGLPQRLSRARSRRRKTFEPSPLGISAVEVLENRNLERSG